MPSLKSKLGSFIANETSPVEISVLLDELVPAMIGPRGAYGAATAIALGT